jgi:site-specific DNA-cytosine methylase
MKLLDLFSGGKCLEKPCQDLGIDYFSVDIDPALKPDLVADISKLWVEDIIQFRPDIVWASPPCECFSVSSIGHHWNPDNTPKTKDAAASIELVWHTIAMIKCMDVKYWFMENPRGKLRKLLDPIRHTVTYCQYGDHRMKPTDIWTNCETWHSRPMCKNGDNCHVSAPRGSRTGTQSSMSYIEKSQIPYDLLVEILTACMV